MKQYNKVGLIFRAVMLLALIPALTGCCLLGICLQREPPQIVLNDNTVTRILPNESIMFSTPKWCFGDEATAKLLEKAEKCKQEPQ